MDEASTVQVKPAPPPNNDYGELPCLEDSTAESTDTSPPAHSEVMENSTIGPVSQLNRMSFNLDDTLPVQFNRIASDMESRMQLIKKKRRRNPNTMLECDECSATFRLLQDFIKHKKLHAGEELYQCHICGKTYTRRDNMKLHMRIHIKERPFSCVQCGETFRYRPNLTRHKHTKHGLPKAYSLSVRKTVQPRTADTERSILTGLLPHYGMFPQNNSVNLDGLQSLVNSVQSTSTAVSATNQISNQAMLNQTIEMGHSAHMPIIGQVYSLNEQQSPNYSHIPVSQIDQSRLQSHAHYLDKEYLHRSQMLSIQNHAGNSNNVTDQESNPSASSPSLPHSVSEGSNSINRKTEELISHSQTSDDKEINNDVLAVHWKVDRKEGMIREVIDETKHCGKDRNDPSQETALLDKDSARTNTDHRDDTACSNSQDDTEKCTDDVPCSSQTDETSCRNSQDVTEKCTDVLYSPQRKEERLKKVNIVGKSNSPTRLPLSRVSLKLNSHNLLRLGSRRKQCLPLRLSMGLAKKSNEVLIRDEDGAEDNETSSSVECTSCERFNEFKCQYCEIAFPDLSMFMIHRGCHGREGAFQCNACGQDCKDRVEFNAHIIKGHFM
ncbi:uncharacterized protein LOC102803377 [Saccoglossus kowalevskii]|uniref:Zinc finger protein 236-like n=1 Tax=Saccoglossus kowalevskii TaxID=10224 RepID=A0ABM0MAX7_SACKO|nr:PREDICTED: zinc finger protein 236-like [Saccoglossus kowalevskii]